MVRHWGTESNLRLASWCNNIDVNNFYGTGNGKYTILLSTPNILSPFPRLQIDMKCIKNFVVRSGADGDETRFANTISHDSIELLQFPS